MTYSISHLDGLDADEVKTLRTMGIRTTEKLLEATKDPKGRRVLSEKTNIGEKRLLACANAADHMRIKGMGKNYIGLLRAAGVNTVRELQYRNPEHLAKAMAEANKKRKVVRFLPPLKLVTRWVEYAKKLPLKITY
jgi:predicted RecB family nuclease